MEITDRGDIGGARLAPQVPDDEARVEVMSCCVA